MSLFNKEQVIEYLPHREPFLFIDSVENLILKDKTVLEKESVSMKDLHGAIAEGSYTPPADHPIFKGHFPGNPIFPGVLQVEMMAQLSCFIISFCVEGEYKNMELDVSLVSVDKTRFRKPLFPEMKLDIKCELLKTRGSFLSFNSQIFNAGEMISECEFMARCQIQEKE